MVVFLILVIGLLSGFGGLAILFPEPDEGLLGLNQFFSVEIVFERKIEGGFSIATPTAGFFNSPFP